MMVRDRLHSWSPVVKAGLSFLAFSAVLLPLGHVLRSSVIVALGSEMVVDGLFYISGGNLSQLLKRSPYHVINCTTREGLELLVLLAGTCAFAFGAFTQKSTDISIAHVVVGLTLGPIAIWMYYFWHRQTEAHEDHHDGFSWHLLADMIAAGSVAVAGPIAYLTGDPAWNSYCAVIALVMVVTLAIFPARRILRRMRHRRANHPDQGSTNAHDHHAHQG